MSQNTKTILSNLFTLTSELTEPQEDEPQETVKSIIEEMQELTHKPYEVSKGDLVVYSDIISGEIDRLLEAIGLTDLSITAEVKDKLPENTLKAQIQELYSLNDSMITADPVSYTHLDVYKRQY